MRDFQVRAHVYATKQSHVTFSHERTTADADGERLLEGERAATKFDREVHLPRLAHLRRTYVTLSTGESAFA